MRTTLKLLLLLLLIYGASLLLLLPATHSYALLRPQLPPAAAPLQVGDLSGTLWQGRAGAVWWQQRPYGAAGWQLWLPGLLQGELQINLQLQPEPTAILNGRLHLTAAQNYYLSAIEGDIAAEWLRQQLPLPLPVTAGGRLELALAQLQPAPQLAANGVVWWRDAHLQASAPLPLDLKLGDLSITLSPLPDGGVLGELGDGGGPLQLRGRVTLQESGHYRIDALLGSRGNDAALAQSLALLGRANSDGQIPISLNGRL